MNEKHVAGIAVESAQDAWLKIEEIFHIYSGGEPEDILLMEKILIAQEKIYLVEQELKKRL